MIGREEKQFTGRGNSGMNSLLQEKYCTVEKKLLLGEKTAEGKLFLRSKI